MFNRAVLLQLQEWKTTEPRKPLILRGARQVGKTSVVRMFAEQFDEYLEFNLEKPSDFDLFEHSLEAKELLQLLLLSRNKSGKGQVLIFIDEIQNSPSAIKILRYFFEEVPHIHLISAGSLLEIVMETKGMSFPVGRVDFLNMYPLTFKEFLTATGETGLLEQLELDHIHLSFHALLLKCFHKYALIGGMPEVVHHFSEHRDVPGLNSIYNALLTAYMDDIEKYAPTSAMKKVLRHCLEMAPFEAGQRIKYAGFGQSNYGSKEVGEALKILERAMVVQLIIPSTSLQIPIVPDFKKSPKLQFLDTGLVNYFAGLQQHYFVQDDLHSIHRGLIAEHIATQEFIALRNNRLKKTCFWVRENSSSNAEVDLLSQYNEQLIPIEIKSGTTGRLRSLHSFIDIAQQPHAVRISSAPLSVENIQTIQGRPYRLIHIPFYWAGDLDRILSSVLEK